MQKKEKLKEMYDEIEEVNRILMLPSKDWTQKQKDLVEFHLNGSRGLFPTSEELKEEECTHDWETRILLTSTYESCKYCGEER